MPTPVPPQSSVPHRSRALGAFYAIAAAAIFSTAGIIVRRIELPAWDVSFWRSALLTVTALPLLLVHRRRSWAAIRSAGWSLVFSALALAGSFISFILALEHAPVANVLIVFGVVPFLTALLARLFLNEPLYRHTIVAMVVAVVGLALSVAGSLKSGAAFGMALAMMVSLCMSANYVIVRHRRDVAMAPAVALAGFISAIIALPFAHPLDVGGRQLLWLLALGPGQLAGGLLFYIASLKRIPAGQAALLGLLELVLGPIWVWVIDGEQPGSFTLLGGAIVIAAAAANVWLDSRRPTG
ncbi:EamA domain-containing membrane protein RarD [Enhydrobacter aerosaccus]|uniref:EamA domain-containing membrane protein RarD n=1 Tax=Enhydrobacter aerosaccus TaxID=225324 RepID=A0A1T4LF98_9HYPH|nr:DMT family transporter [Enhydrobacter aerosaccus]SJZ53395.1 EamA domain-containing membrane protein RarD [Enhydrobacter aerosaccus]